MRKAAALCVARLVHISRCGTATVCSTEAAPALPQLCGIITVTQALPPFSTTAFFATATQRQIVKLQQQPSSNSDHRQSWTKPLLSAGAVAAVAAGTWALWSTPAANQVQADAATPAGLSGSSIQTQSAIVSCFLGPLVTLLQGLTPTDLQMQAMAKTLADDAASLNPRDLLDSIWGLAMLGAQLDIDQLETLCNAAVANLQQYSVYQAIAAVQSVIMLCRGSSSSNSAATAQLAATAWQQLLQRLKTAQSEEYDEAAVLYLLHAAFQQAAAAAAGTTAAAGDVRASLQEVLQQVDALPKRVKSMVVAAYQEYVPFQGYIESPFLIILHILKTLPSYISAQPAAVPSPPPNSQTPPPAAAAGGPYNTVFQGFTRADADAAVTVVSDSGALGKLRRELFYTWRSDQLLDRHQRNLNQVAHVLNRILQLPLKQPADVDVLLPTLKTVILLEEDTSTITPQHQPPQGSRLLQQQQLDISDPQLLLKPQYHAACHDALVTLMRNKYSAPPGGFACKSTEGIRSAKQWCLEQRGFRVVHIGINEVERCGGMSAGQHPRNKPADYSALEALLRSRLKL